MNLDHDFVQVSKLSKDQKKIFTKNGTLFSSNSGKGQKKILTKNGTHFFYQFQAKTKKKGLHQKWKTFWTPTLRCTPELNYWGDADVDHTQTMGGDTVKSLPPIPPGFRRPCCQVDD